MEKRREKMRYRYTEASVEHHGASVETGASVINSHYGAMKYFNRNSGTARGADQIIFNIRKNEY